MGLGSGIRKKPDPGSGSAALDRTIYTVYNRTNYWIEEMAQFAKAALVGR
jgi:hypothetical protein